MHNIPIPSVQILIMGNGLIETVFGLLLFAGLFTRLSALLLTIHLLGIAVSLGYNDILIRDLGLSLATFTVFLNGADKWSLDNKIKLSSLLHRAFTKKKERKKRK